MLASWHIADQRPRSGWILAPLLLLASFQLAWVTTLGPGVHEDSYSYMDTAWGLLHGYGFQRDGYPATHFPPLYPMLLASTQVLAGNLTEGARWLHVLLYGVNLVLIGALGYRISGGSVLALVLAPLAVVLSGELLVVYSTAASESPFIALMLAGLLVLAAHIAAPRWQRILAAAVLLGLAAAMRYVGVTLLAAAVISLFVLQRRSFTERVRDCLTFSFVSAIPLGLWIIRNLLVIGGATDRQFVFHPAGLHHLKELLAKLCYLYFPLEVSPWYILPVLAGVGVLAGSELYRQRFDTRAKALVFLLAVFSAVYVAFLFVSISFFDASTEFEYRILAPLAVCALVLTVSLCVTLAVTAERRSARWLLATFVGSILAANMPHQWNIATDLHLNGYYYNSREWRESETLAYVGSIPPAVTLYSNHPHGLSYRLGRRTRMVPRKTMPMTLLPARDFDRSIAAMCDDVTSNGAVIAFLEGERWYLPGSDEVQGACRTNSVRRLRDGVVFQHQYARAVTIDPTAH